MSSSARNLRTGSDFDILLIKKGAMIDMDQFEKVEQFLPLADEVRVFATGVRVTEVARKEIALFLSDERILVVSDETPKKANGFYYLAIPYDKVDFFEYAKNDDAIELSLYAKGQVFRFEAIVAMDEERFFEALFEKVGQAEYEHYM